MVGGIRGLLLLVVVVVRGMWVRVMLVVLPLGVRRVRVRVGRMMSGRIGRLCWQGGGGGLWWMMEWVDG